MNHQAINKWTDIEKPKKYGNMKFFHERNADYGAAGSCNS
jgi:hypothetical protein